LRKGFAMNVFKNNLSAFCFALLLSVPFFSSCKSGKTTSSSQAYSNDHGASSAQIEKKYALLLNVPEKNISNVKLYSFIEDWYGVPYKYGGKNKSGIDCSNFTSALYQNIYNKSLSGSSSSIYTQCKIISKKDLKEGDLLFFKIENDNISHIGVYLQNNKFVHATTKKGVMINDLDEAYYKKYFYKAGRLTE
jgi:murein DD-endopeptidase / murein LD-carboxypeptidase